MAALLLEYRVILPTPAEEIRKSWHTEVDSPRRDLEFQCGCKLAQGEAKVVDFDAPFGKMTDAVYLYRCYHTQSQKCQADSSVRHDPDYMVECWQTDFHIRSIGKVLNSQENLYRRVEHLVVPSTASTVAQFVNNAFLLLPFQQNQRRIVVIDLRRKDPKAETLEKFCKKEESLSSKKMAHAPLAVIYSLIEDNYNGTLWQIPEDEIRERSHKELQAFYRAFDVDLPIAPKRSVVLQLGIFAMIKRVITTTTSIIRKSIKRTGKQLVENQ